MGAALYRHFAADGSLLYVGVSISALKRLHSHSKNSHWFSDIASITLSHFETMDLAKAAEKCAIRAEGPRYNIHWWVSRPQPRPRTRIRTLRCPPCEAKMPTPPRWCHECDRLYMAQYRVKNSMVINANQRARRAPRRSLPCAPP